MSYRAYTGERKPFRSGFRGGRGRGRGGSTPMAFPNDSVASPVDKDKDLMEALHDSPLQTIARPEEQAVSDITTADFKYIGSYNWTNRESTTIIVPGSPPEWQNRRTPYTVEADVGVHFVDQNSFRLPTSPLLPLVAAVEVLARDDGDSSVDWPEIDFVTDRNGLRKLMRWIDVADKEFRIDLQLAGTKTVLFSRWEKRTRERLPGFTFGFNFEKASTKPAIRCSESTGHHRIVSYDMSGLKMVVRFEVDACLPDPKKPKAQSSSTSNVDDLINSLAAVKISSGKVPAANEGRSEATSTELKGSLSTVKIIRGGSRIPQSSIVEMCTRSEKRQYEFDWKNAYPQLFLSQTPHHFMAVHQRGTFTQVNHRTLDSPELKKIEKEIQPDLKKLVRALQIIQEIVIKHGQRGRLSLVYRDGEMKLYERVSSDGCLPDDVMDLFN